MLIPSKYYNVLKWLTLIFLPAVNTAIFTLGQVWGFDNVAQIVGTIAAINTLLGVSIGISTAQYNASDEKYDGTIDPVFANQQTSDAALALDSPASGLLNQKEVLLKVAPSQGPV